MLVECMALFRVWHFCGGVQNDVPVDSVTDHLWGLRGPQPQGLVSQWRRRPEPIVLRLIVCYTFGH